MKGKKEKTEKFLKSFGRSNPQPEKFQIMAADYLLDQLVLETENDQEKIEKIKELFWLTCKTEMDEAALYLLKLIREIYDFKEENIAQGPKGDHHLGNAAKRAKHQFHHWLIDAYWHLEDGKEHDRPVLLKPVLPETKCWILERIANVWTPSKMLDDAASKEAIQKAFSFLIAAYGNRWVSQEEKKQIIRLVTEGNTSFEPEELEKWMEQPFLPDELERVLAIARTRNGGPNGWRADIRNAKLVRSFNPANRSKAAFELFQRQGELIASIDRSVQKLIKGMTKDQDLLYKEKIGKSEYVLGEKEWDYNHLFEVIINIQVDTRHSEALFQDNFGRARRHIQAWLRDNRSFRIRLAMNGGKTNAKYVSTLQGESRRQS
jgi:hypothetical protein